MRERLETDNTYGWRMAEYDAGVHVQRADENVAEIVALGELLGGPVGIDGVLDDLDRRARRSWWTPGRAVDRALTWDRADRKDPRWWPQGISTSADASDTSDTGEIAGRQVLAISWYAKEAADGHHGSRITFLDLATRRYRHVLLVVPSVEDGQLRLEPLRVHAGGIVWCGPYLHIAATARGFVTCRIDDIMRVSQEGSGDESRLGVDEDRVSSFGYRYVLPVRFTYQASADEGQERLRYSFLSLDREVSPPELVVGEYGRGHQTTRLVRFPLDPETLLLAHDEDGASRPLIVADSGVAQTQGAVVARGTYYLTVSHGPFTRGSVYVGRPGDFRRHGRAAPIGPEDITYWPSTDQLWSVSEHPRRRWVYSMRRGWFD